MRIFTVSLVLLCLLAVSVVLAWGDVFVGQRVSGSVSMDDMNHSRLDGLLRKYVDKDGMVDYRKWHDAPSDIDELDEYLRELSQAMTDGASQDGRLAFWINAYNAVTLRGILREYPTDSIRNHTAKVFGYNIWEDLHLYVDGQPYSLDTIEHQILRKMDEPRIHFAIVCASIGCPRLLNQAYTPDAVDQQLDDNAHDFFRRDQNFRYDESQQQFHLSQILNWFGSDFGASKSVRLKRIAPWLPTEAARNAAESGDVQISWIKYNWKLNSQR